MNTIRFNDKASFVAALEARRPFWRARDAANAKAHKAAEQKWLTDTKRKLREALKLDYDALKKATKYDGLLGQLDRAPSCPVLMEKKIDTVLASLKVTQGKTFVVQPTMRTGYQPWAVAFDLLTADPDAKTTVC